jgi:D-amino-acid dehydrogenase
MEFGGDNPPFDSRRVDAIIAGLGRFLNLDFASRKDTWAGSRPMSPDGLALLGRVKGWSNLTIAGGHGMHGLALAPVSGMAMAELLTEGRSSVDLSAFNPNRFRL